MANGGGRKDGRTDGRMEIPPCVLQDIGPLGPLPKKDLKLSHFTHFKKLMKNNKFSSSQYKFSKHIGPVECNRPKIQP